MSVLVFCPSGKAAWRQSAQSPVPSSRPSWLSVRAVCSWVMLNHNWRRACRPKRDTSFSSLTLCSSPRPSKCPSVKMSVYVVVWHKQENAEWKTFEKQSSNISSAPRCLSEAVLLLFSPQYSLLYSLLSLLPPLFSPHYIIISQPIKSIWSLAQIKATLACSTGLPTHKLQHTQSKIETQRPHICFWSPQTHIRALTHTYKHIDKWRGKQSSVCFTYCTHTRHSRTSVVMCQWAELTPSSAEQTLYNWLLHCGWTQGDSEECVGMCVFAEEKEEKLNDVCLCAFISG